MAAQARGPMHIQPSAPTVRSPKPPSHLIESPEKVELAKWPPDDDGPAGPPGSPYGQGGGGGSDDGNFRKGATKPIAIVLTMLILAGGGALAYFGAKQEAVKMTKDEVNKERVAIQLLPKDERIARHRKWAAQEEEPRLQQEAFIQLAWAKDKQSIPLMIKGLSSIDHGVRGTAASALMDFGSPDADSAKAALQKALTEADSSDKPQICWALAQLHDTASFDAVLTEYRMGHLSTVQRLDGFPAFDRELLASMTTLDKLASLANDDSESVRQFVATSLARTGDPKWTQVLIKLVQDKSTDIAREAAVGLGKIANEEAMKPLLDALMKADKDSRAQFLEALRDGIGARGLVLALKSVSHAKPETEKFQTKVIFDMLKALEDPRGADAIYAYIQTNPHPHWKTEAALRLAEIGDVRASEALGWRLMQDPLALYDKVDWPELRRDDNERVYAARMLADLAVLHPEAHATLIKNAEEGALFWTDPKQKPQPHANALRFLAAVGSKKILPQLRLWADPKDPLPPPGVEIVPPVWETVQSALRYYGWAEGPNAFALLDKQLHRRKPKLDVSMDALRGNGLTVLGMSLRALAYGAADGFAQAGDPRAFPDLVKFIEDPEEHGDARAEACFALSWVATDEQMKEIVKKVRDVPKADSKNERTAADAAFMRSCYLATLVHRPVPSATASLVDLLGPQVADLDVRYQLARAIGMGGLTKEMIPPLFEKLKDTNTRSSAALALILGADPDTAARAIATFNDAPDVALEELKTVYDKTFGYWSDKNYTNGDIARWIDNAEAISHVRVHDVLQGWTSILLSRNIVDSIEFDSGPHSMTKVVFRNRLLNDAKGADETKRVQAINILKFMKEKGVLMALRNEPGPVGELARRAFFEVMHPKTTTERLPEAASAKATEKGAGQR